MSFLAPMLWPLLALVTVPLVIHLLTRRPPKPLVFAPIALLRRAMRRQERRLRLRRWLLLLFRTAWVGCFIVAALQPQCGQEAVVEEGDLGAIALVIDSSGSMATQGADGTTFFQRAVDHAQSHASRRPVSLFACTYDGIKRLAPEPRSALSVGHLMAPIRAMGRVDLAACAQAVSGEVLLITDGWSRLPQGVAHHRVAQADEGKNWGLGEVTLSRRGGNSYGLRVAVIGRAGKRRLRAVVDAETRAQVRVEIPASGHAFGVLTLGLKPGFHAVTLVLDEDARGDDNHRVVGLNAAGATRVLAINGDARDTAYADELFYVGQAARALGHHDPFELAVVGVGEEERAPLQDSDVVVLANTAELDPGFVQALRAFVVSGGGLLVTVGQNTQPMRLEQQLGDLVPVRPRSRWLAKDEEGQASRAAGQAVAAPQAGLIKALGLKGGAGLLRTRVWSGLNVEARGEVHWRLKDGRALLVESSLGSGRVAMLTTSIDRDDADAAIRPGFVPFLRGYLRRLSGEHASRLSPSFVPGQLWRSGPMQGQASFRRLRGGVAQAQRQGDELVFAPPRFGLWHAQALGLHVELRSDPAESMPYGAEKGDDEPKLGATSSATDQHPLWPLLLGFALLFVAAEAALVWVDHRARAA